jgi:hypothetical protein
MRHVRLSLTQRMGLLGGAVALAVLVCASLAIQSPLAAGASAPTDRAGVEAQVAGVDLPGRLEAALGSAFGGVWYEPSGAALHVGVTSPEARRAAEAVAARAGLAEDVDPVPVESTWAQLEAAQGRWNERLRGLFARGEVSTSLAADDNAVLVELANSAPGSVRAALVSEAATDLVGVQVQRIPDSRLRAQPFARCAALAAKFKAYCNPTLVSGVSIDDEKEVEQKGDCTAGPLAIRHEPTSEAASTETFLLTAGHCLTGEGAVGKKWFAFEKGGKAAERKKIGVASAALVTELKVGVDVGVVPLEAEPWKTAANPPLTPVIANWNATKESEPFPVIKQTAPAKDAKTCFSGQRSGIQCGKITATGKTIPIMEEIGGKEVQVGEWVQAYEVSLSTGKGGRGDSGSPFFSEAPYKEHSEGDVEGILVGGLGEESATVYAQPLSFLFEQLKALKGLDYELLTTAKEKRM